MTDPGPPAPRLRRDWTAAFVLGELVGFVPPAVTGAALGAANAPDLVLVVGLTVAGAMEGAVLGMAQATVLRRHAPAVDRRRWVVATAVAASFAWFVGMGGGAAMGSSGGSPALLVLLVPAWCAALLAMGFAQWRVLREVVPGSGRWVPVNAAAWLVGVMIPVVAISAVPNEAPVPVFVAVAVAAAVAMGATVGAITGRTLARLLDRIGAESWRFREPRPRRPDATARPT